MDKGSCVGKMTKEFILEKITTTHPKDNDITSEFLDNFHSISESEPEP
jgi:hypothetical protein